MKPNLVLITSNFPFGSGETFLETELPFLARKFDVLIIPMDQMGGKKRTIPENCKILNYSYSLNSFSKIKSLKLIFDRNFINEFLNVKNIYQKKTSIALIKTNLISLKKGYDLAEYISNIKGIDFGSTVFYSYWCEDTALGIALAHKKNNQIKGVSRAHRWDLYFDANPLNYLPFRKLISSNLSYILPISNQGVLAIKNEWKITDLTNISVSKLGVNFNKKLNNSDNLDIIKIISCSNVIKVKRVKLIAEALRTISNINISWTHFGDGELMGELKEIVQDLPSNIQVNLVGRVPNNVVYEKYKEIKPQILINVSSSEGIPVSIMEAMSFGIPCIATNVGGNSEIVTRSNGFLLPETPKLEEITDAIIEIVNNISQRSDNAYKTWENEYNAETNYNQFCEKLLSLIEK